MYFHTLDFNFLMSVSKSIVPARNSRIFGLNALARNTIELTITTIVITTHEVVHGQFPCHTRRIPDPTSTWPACLTSRIAAWNTSNEVSIISLFLPFILFNNGNRTKNGPIDKTALITCMKIMNVYISKQLPTASIPDFP